MLNYGRCLLELRKCAKAEEVLEKSAMSFSRLAEGDRDEAMERLSFFNLGHA